MQGSGTTAKALIERLRGKKAVVGIVGLGYVGLPLMLRLVEVGAKVIGIDTDEAKVAAANRGRSYIRHISSASMAAARAAGFSATTSFAAAAKCDALIICVPTPLGSQREPDLSFVESAARALAPHLRKGQIVSLESTTYPGTTEELVRPIVERRGLKVGRELFLAYSPEREDPGNSRFTTRTIPKVVSGCTEACKQVACALYGRIVDKVVPVSSTRAAELTKLLENIHRAVNIGLVNEIKIVADRMGIDIFEVVRAAATKPFGFVPYFPGPGLGGHCIPVDPFYLTWKAREYGVHTRFIELAGDVNRAMPEWVVGKVIGALNDRKRPLKGAKVLVLGIAYKKNIDDLRESPSLEILKLLAAEGAAIAYSDPYVPRVAGLHEYPGLSLRSVVLNPQALQRADCVIVATDHSDFDYKMIRRHARLIVDSRGVYESTDPRVVRA